MARKHNAPHPDRGKSRYRERLARRGQSGSSVMMLSVEDLRRIQNARFGRQGDWWPTAHSDAAEQAGGAR